MSYGCRSESRPDRGNEVSGAGPWPRLAEPESIPRKVKCLNIEWVVSVHVGVWLRTLLAVTRSHLLGVDLMWIPDVKSNQ